MVALRMGNLVRMTIRISMLRPISSVRSSYNLTRNTGKWTKDIFGYAFRFLVPCYFVSTVTQIHKNETKTEANLPSQAQFDAAGDVTLKDPLD